MGLTKYYLGGKNLPTSYKNAFIGVKMNTVGPRNNSLAFKGSLSIKVNILRSQMIVFNVILPLFKGNSEIKVKNLQSQWDR